MRDRPLSPNWYAPEWIAPIIPAFTTDRLNLAAVHTVSALAMSGAQDSDRYTSYARRPAPYVGRYDGILTFRTVPRVMDELHRLELIDHDKAPPGRYGKQSRARLTRDALAIIGEPFDIVCEPPEPIILKDADKQRMDVPDTRRARRVTDQLQGINEPIAATEITLLVGAHTGRIIRRGDQILVLDKRTLYRVGNNGSLYLGMRFYGGWWINASEADRAHIHINGSPTVEEDYPNLHPQLIYALAGRTLEGDAYRGGGMDRWPRKPVCKAAFFAMVNSNTPRQMIGAVQDILAAAGRPRSEAVLLIEAIEKRHDPIRKCFGTGIGLRLQYVDSEIAARVMTDMNRKGDVILPVHDSFIAEKKHQSELLESMEKNLQKTLKNPEKIAA